MRIVMTIYFVTCFAFVSKSQSLVIPGDFPDPSVVKIGGRFWATATTSNWAPTFPLLSSSDLLSWRNEGFTFSKLPEWADYYFWAPELSFENGKVYLYYSAHKKGGGLCIGIASAPDPRGPYTDHGPVMCQDVGSIDAFAMRDENGKLYLIWKEDGNSVKKPTPIWAAELNESRTQVIGEKKELFRNTEVWEANLVEGVSMMRRGKYFYAFYSAAGCCGRGCTYAMGVARSTSLLGPWEKYSANPVMSGTPTWKCPGHGTPVEKNGRFYFLYHAYNTKGDVYVGRQGVLSEFVFTDDNWIDFLSSHNSLANVPDIVDDAFSDDTLRSDWQWSVFDTLRVNQEVGVLNLFAKNRKSGAFIGQKALSIPFEAEVTLMPFMSEAAAGIALVGDDNNLIALTYLNKKATLWKLEEGKETIINEWPAQGQTSLKMKVEFRNYDDVRFYFQSGKGYKFLGPKLSGFFLPPWDRAVRVGLIAKGPNDQFATFDSFVLKNK